MASEVFKLFRKLGRHVLGAVRGRETEHHKDRLVGFCVLGTREEGQTVVDD